MHLFTLYIVNAAIKDVVDNTNGRLHDLTFKLNISVRALSNFLKYHKLI